jgi:hypothetical protein
MKHVLGSLAFLCVLLTACNDASESISVHPYFAYFYPVDSIPKVYQYRDVQNGLVEQFHRVYAIQDSEGQHVIVERYSGDRRIIEALNYNVDSLDIMDHMVVNRKGEKTKADVFRTKVIPMDKDDEAYFASRFQGFLDSTLILQEIRRTVVKETKRNVLNKSTEVIEFADNIRMTNFNPFTRKETVLEGKAVAYFAKGIGLVEWYTTDKKVHYRLEKIMNQEEWVKLITR